MTAERRASRRARAAAGFARGRARPTLLLALAFASTLGACRQTVILDPSEKGDGGGAGTGVADATGAGGRGGAGGAGGAAGGAGAGGNRDGGRTDVPPFCFGGGQIQQLRAETRAPDVIIAVDRSASMQTWWGQGTRLANVQLNVLALVSKYQNAVRFGYEEFPSSHGMCGNGLGCCAGEVTTPVFRNLQAITQEVGACSNNGGGCVQVQRPLADALARCRSTFSSLTSPTGRGRYLIVLTGGDPTCGGNADGGTSMCDPAVKEVTNLNRDEEVNTAIISVGGEAAGSECLDKLASIGGLGDVGKSPVHLALTPSELSQAMTSLVGTMAAEACHIDIRSPPVNPDSVALSIGGMDVPIDPVSGWTFDSGSNSKITVHGTWCDKLIGQDSRALEVVSRTGCQPRP